MNYRMKAEDKRTTLEATLQGTANSLRLRLVFLPGEMLLAHAAMFMG
jgi:hypothetical protein